MSRQMDKQSYNQTDGRQEDNSQTRQMDKLSYNQTDGQTERQSDKQKGRQTVR